MREAIEQLTNHQQQLDQDGIMVGVSRQAVDEVLASLAARDAEIARLREALISTADYLDKLESVLIEHDIDMQITAIAPPSIAAENARAALETSHDPTSK